MNLLVHALQGLQLCRPLPGAVTTPMTTPAGRAYPSFNCAAPFRGRLPAPPGVAAMSLFQLQLCRHLPGAVTVDTSGSLNTQQLASIVPPPSGGGYGLPAAAVRWRDRSFNCAAPFRGRLRHYRRVLLPHRPPPSIVPPPSGGGYLHPGLLWHSRPLPSIVPPPSGGGYSVGNLVIPAGVGPSIVPPPSGGGYP